MKAVAAKRNELISPNCIRIQPEFLLYIERIFVRFFAGIAGYGKKKTDEKTTIENNNTAESLNTQNRENYRQSNDLG